MLRNPAFLLSLAIAPLAGCTGAAGPVASAQASGRQCFLASQVNGFGNASTDSVDVWVNANRYYRLSLLGTCNDINWSNRIGLRTTGGSSWICEGNDAEIIVPGPIGGRCLVTDVRPITEEQWNARKQG